MQSQKNQRKKYPENCPEVKRYEKCIKKTRLKFKCQKQIEKINTHHFILRSSKKYARIRKSIKIQSFLCEKDMIKQCIQKNQI